MSTEEKPLGEWTFDELRYDAMNSVYELIATLHGISPGYVKPEHALRVGMFFGSLGKHIERWQKIEEAALAALAYFDAVGMYENLTSQQEEIQHELGCALIRKDK